jgi:capsular polysaccharide biosynthesis protein
LTAGLEASAAEEFLVTTLTGDATLMAQLSGGVWSMEAPEGTVYPFLVFQFVSGIDYAAVGAQRIWTNMIYLVKVIAETADFSVMNAAVARIDALLHRASGVVADGTVWSCTREQIIRLPDDVANDQFRQAGGLYRLYAA